MLTRAACVFHSISTFHLLNRINLRFPESSQCREERAALFQALNRRTLLLYYAIDNIRFGLRYLSKPQKST